MTHVVFVGDSLFYEGIDKDDASLNCPPNGRIVCLDDSQLDKLVSRRNRIAEACAVLQQHEEWN
jgi:hypothetical protein